MVAIVINLRMPKKYKSDFSNVRPSIRSMVRIAATRV